MGMFMGVWGWWAFDIFTLMASYLSVSVVSAQTIMRSLGLLTFMIPVGFSVACGILVGKAIGKGSAEEVKFYYVTSMQMSIIVALIQNVILIALRDQIIAVFTSISPIVAQIQ